MPKKMKLFPMNDVFLFKRGTRLISSEQIEGEIPYISSTKKNNGVDNYINPPEKMEIYKNRMTISNSGSVGYLFYHDYEFVASDHVTVIWLKNQNIKLTRNIALYLKPIFESIRYKYNFGREISNKRLKKEFILLPVNEKDEVDWFYMDNTVISLLNKVTFNSLESNISNKSVTTGDWADFTFDELFHIKRGDSEYLKDMEYGEYPYVSATANNHGISGFVDKFNRDFKCIVLNYDGSIGEAFYHTEPFFASEKVVTLTLKNKELNIYIAQFLITMIKQEKFRYSYGLKWSVETRMRNSTIKLPSTKKNNRIVPDWDYIERFIKTMSYSRFIKHSK